MRSPLSKCFNSRASSEGDSKYDIFSNRSYRNDSTTNETSCKARTLEGFREPFSGPFLDDKGGMRVVERAREPKKLNQMPAKLAFCLKTAVFVGGDQPVLQARCPVSPFLARIPSGVSTSLRSPISQLIAMYPRIKSSIRRSRRHRCQQRFSGSRPGRPGPSHRRRLGQPRSDGA